MTEKIRGELGPVLLPDDPSVDGRAHRDCERIPVTEVHAKGSGARGTFMPSHGMPHDTRASRSPEAGKPAPLLAHDTDGSTEDRAPDAKTWVWLFAGHLLFILGLAGLALPLLPTTIFWIGAAACFARSSPGMYQRIIGHGRLGKAIDDFLNHNVIAPAGKAAALAGMAGAAVLIALSPLDSLPSHLALIGLALAAGYVLTRPNRVATSFDAHRSRAPGTVLGRCETEPAEACP